MFYLKTNARKAIAPTNITRNTVKSQVSQHVYTHAIHESNVCQTESEILCTIVICNPSTAVSHCL